MLTGLFSSRIIIAAVVAFFVGRVVLMGELMPFIPAFAAATAVLFGARGILAVIMLSAGAGTVIGGYQLTTYTVLALTAFLFSQSVPIKYSGRWVIPLLVLGLTISVKSAFLAFSEPTPYDYISIVFEGLFAALLVPACISSFTAARKINGIKQLNTEETVCLLVLTAGVIAGTGELALWYISLKGFLSRTIILFAALVGGAGTGAAAGAVVGIIPGLSYTVAPYLIGAYSFSGLLAGLGRMMGKVGVALSFLASNIILSIYFSSFDSMGSVIAETTMACLVFLLIPESFLRGISAAVIQEPANLRENNQEVCQGVLKEKMKEFSSILEELALNFSETAISEKRDNEQGLKQLMGEISKKACDGCGMFNVCWQNDYYRTYQYMLEMFTLTEMHGRVKVSDIPEELKVRCTRPRELTITASCLYEAFKVDRYWNKKFSIGKGMVGEQLKGMAAIVESLSEEFDCRADDQTDTDSIIKKKLRQSGLPVKEIKISDIGGKREISVAMKACKGELDCRYRVAPMVSDMLTQLFSVTGCICEGLNRVGLCRFRLYQGPQYRLDVGTAWAGKNGCSVSGDVYEFLQLKEGKFAAILSDGMGTGEEAARESTSAIALLRKMLDAGLEVEAAVKSVNSVQALKNPEDSFATLDMAVINLYSGQAEFIKIAAPPTFLIRGERVKSVHANSLPVGVVKDIDINVTEKKLASGDIIVMLTDGIIEAYKGTMDRDDWIKGVLQELNGLHPKEMAELLLKLAQTVNGGEPEIYDDMTVLVIRLEKEKVVEFPK